MRGLAFTKNVDEDAFSYSKSFSNGFALLKLNADSTKSGTIVLITCGGRRSVVLSVFN